MRNNQSDTEESFLECFAMAVWLLIMAYGVCWLIPMAGAAFGVQ